ncbi:PhzF family phenazine biosynthesis protein [Tunicatimonas pelagia]|uniref:PhzF family phenazine biosynthesis protein n=1 Tax=Tunicatimonas pelagia TaxID=931531 RepID=UPI002666988E|nr:PhzF family phenazine biosynthesis protein [Tunicatimonas pelagia]WKN41921.1 PhzF family phenazine biosynthesis protein [Tunicatimonas pelagia]
MKIEIYQIDTFTDKLFGGNPAAVCPLDEWLEDTVLQQIAAENNLAETAFFVKHPNNTFHLRWFTPEFEIDLCGHATLATAFVLFEECGYSENEIIFETQSGVLNVRKVNDLFELNFPARPPKKSALPQIIKDGLNLKPKEVWKARDYLLLYDSEDDIRNIKPDTSILNQINIDPGGIIVTAKGHSRDVDFVSRLFTPQASVFEDPVTGSAHCTLIPFWSERLKKTKFRALQISERGGTLFCELDQELERVNISGKAIKYLHGAIEI